MNNMKNRILPFLRILKFNIYVIGYANQGESIIFTLENDYGIIYSGVIDCFENDNLNQTINILNNLKIEKLDVLCWTHPHEDHTIGMDKLIEQYTSEKTKLIYPANVYNVNQQNYHTKKTSDMIKKVILSRKKKKPSLSPINGFKPIDRKQLGNQPDNFYELEIMALTPVSEILERRILEGKVNTPNDYSISIIISVGGINFLFGGDIQDTTIKKVDKNYIPLKIDYIKIPHHASKHSIALLNWCSRINKSSISCTTEYSSSNLPDKDVIDKYKLYFNEIYCTSKKDGDKKGFGVIHTIFDVIDNSFLTEIKEDAYIMHIDDLSLKYKKI